jgi:hypothetical protein
VRAGLKNISTPAWKNDNSLRSIQEDVLKASIPLVKAIEELQQKGETNRLLSSAGSLLGSAVQRLSVYRHRHAESVFKNGFLREVTPSMTCLLGDKWTEQVEEEEKVNKVTQKVVKTTFRESGQSKHFAKGKGKSYKGKGKYNKYRKGKQGHSYNADSGRHVASGYDGGQGQSSFRQGQSSFRSFPQTQDQFRFQKDFKEKKNFRTGAKN